MRTVRPTVLFLAAAVFGGANVPARGIIPSESTKQFLDARPGAVAVHENDRIVAVHGPALAEKIDPQTAAADFLGTFFATPVAPPATATNIDALTGYTGVQLVFKREDLVGQHPANPANPKFRIVTYGQTIAGLEVHGAIFKAVFFLGVTETIPMFNIGVVPPPVVPLPIDNVSAQAAINTAAAHPFFHHLTEFVNPQKVIYEDYNGKLHRVWRIHGYGEADGYWFFIDTHYGQIVGVQKVVDNFIPITGTVRGFAVDGTAADDPWVSIPIPGAQVEGHQGPAACPSEAGALLDSGFSQFGPINEGFYTLEFPVGGRVTSRLTSNYTTVHDCSGLDETQLFDCEALAYLPDGQWVATDLLACKDTSLGSPVDPVFNMGADYEPDTAQVTIFHGVQRTYDWFHQLHPSYAGLDQNIGALANYPASCNAFYDTIGRYMAFYRTGGACRNRGLSRTVISHEYGHAIVRELLDYSVSPFTNEALADTIAGFVWDTPIQGENVNSSCQLTGCSSCCQDFVRHLDWTNPNNPGVEAEVRFNQNPSLPCWCHCGVGTPVPHCRSMALSQAFWDTRDNLIALNPGDPQAGKDMADRLLGDFLFITDGKWDRSLLVELLIADDDDGTLQTPTPRTASIVDSFTFRHGWGPVYLGVDDGTVHVNWEGPAGNPVEGTDYYLYHNVDPPSVKLLSTLGGGDFIVRWFVRRYDANNQPLDLGTVTAEWDNQTNRNIRVEVGTPFVGETAPRCNSLQTVDIPAQSNDHYSSAVVTLAGDLTVRAAPQAAAPRCAGGGNDGDPCADDSDCPDGACVRRGGRVSGSFEGDHALIDVQAVGLDDAQPGQLDFNDVPHVLDGGGEIILGEHTAGSLLDVDYSDRPLTIQREMHGDVRYGTLLSVGTFGGLDASPFGGWRGSISILGGGTSTGDITIDDPDGGLQGARISINGSYSGDITVSRMQPFTSPGSNYSGHSRITIADTLLGTLTIDTMDPVTPLGLLQSEPQLIQMNRLSGAIHVHDDLVGELVIDGPGVSTGDIVVDGAIVGNVLIQGSWGTGADICASNLMGAAPSGWLPPNVVICGFSGGTVCGSFPRLGPYGDVAPAPFGNGTVNLDDILYVLSGFSDCDAFSYGDIAPCGGNGTCNLDDILAVLAAFTGDYACGLRTGCN